MNYIPSPFAIAIFSAFVVSVLVIAYYFANRTKSSEGYFAAGGTIHWSVNGIAFAGDYLSAASFLGICGMIATIGYDGFLYSIGYLAGWVVALFIVAEPMKRLGKYTFADALDAKFKSKGVRLMAAVSTLIVSIFYLIPQMVGAGTLVTPLLGLPHWAGVIMVGTIVVIIVATAGMASTTYVQFLKGGLLIIFSLLLSIMVINKGVMAEPNLKDTSFHKMRTINITSKSWNNIEIEDLSYKVEKVFSSGDMTFVKLMNDEGFSIWKVNDDHIEETLYVSDTPEGKLYNGAPKNEGRFFQVGNVSQLNGQAVKDTGSLGPFEFISKIKESTIIRYKSKVIEDGDSKHTIYYQNPTNGRELLRPGMAYKLDNDKGSKLIDKLDFVSLMIALLFGTAALPHVLIRYYTVPDPASARKSTIVAIAGIGFFYILTIYMGLGAMINGVIDVTNSNMSAPLLAKSFGIGIFSIISAIAFATVLGTVSGLIVAASGAVAHDVMDKFMKIKLTDRAKVTAGKIAAILVGIIAMILGVLFEGMNVSYLVGWAFAVAASANFPAIAMVLFWKKTTAKGIMASVGVGLFSSLGLILLSQKTFDKVYHLVDVTAPVQLNNPALISIPLSILTVVVVSLMTQKDTEMIPNS
ncbi:MAG: cation acetate symporter [Clostridia bacterium]|nr:cation acetate symporter [Clostridia bacterium]